MLPVLPVGNYTVDLTAVTDENHTSSTNTSSITVNKAPSSVIPTAEDIHVGENATIDVKVAPEDATGTVNITVDGKTYTDVPVVNGTAQIIVPGLPADNYTVNVTYSGDDNYLPSQNTTSFEVKKVDPTINVDAPTITVGEDGIITVTLPEDATGTVTIEIDGINYTAPVKDGKAVFNVSNLTVGIHDIKAYYSGDDKYYPANAMGTIEVLPVDTPKNPQNDKIEHVNTDLRLHETGNPIMVILLVLLALGSCALRRFKL